jgi:arabinogalactan endo-1,4-beta-galactosidase
MTPDAVMTLIRRENPSMKLLTTVLRFLPLLIPIASASAAATSQPFHRTGPFLIGADISWVQEDEANGTTYFDHGRQQDLFQILKSHGFNAVRLRVFVNPSAPKGYASTSKESFCDLPHALVMARRVHDAGMTLLIDLHYSDTWADPGKQFKPAAWENLDFPALRQAVYDHTKEVLTALKQNGTTPAMVQIGNETTNGMLWPDGRLPTNFDNFADLLKSGIAAARAVDPEIKIVLHHDKGRNNQAVRYWLDQLISRGVQFDIIGLSCNDSGSPDRWKENFEDLATRYPQYGLLAAEYSYHKRECNQAVYTAPDRRGIGTFIWEPTRHHEAFFSPHLDPAAPPQPSTVGAAGHRPRTNRFDTNELIDIYPSLSKEFAPQPPGK